MNLNILKAVKFLFFFIKLLCDKVFKFTFLSREFLNWILLEYIYIFFFPLFLLISLYFYINYFKILHNFFEHFCITLSFFMYAIVKFYLPFLLIAHANNQREQEKDLARFSEWILPLESMFMHYLCIWNWLCRLPHLYLLRYHGR